MSLDGILVPVDYVKGSLDQISPDAILQAYAALQGHSQQVIQTALARTPISPSIQEEIKIMGADLSLKEPFYASRFALREDQRQNYDTQLEQRLYTAAVEERKREQERRKREEKREDKAFEQTMEALADQRRFERIRHERMYWNEVGRRRQEYRTQHLEELRNQTELLEDIRRETEYARDNHLGYVGGGIIGGAIGAGLAALLLL